MSIFPMKEDYERLISRSYQLTEAEDPDAFNTALAKLMKRLKKDTGATKIRQNYKGTGGQKHRRQLYADWPNVGFGGGFDFWLETDRVKFGGVQSTSMPDMPHEATPELTYRKMVPIVKAWVKAQQTKHAQESVEFPEGFKRDRFSTKAHHVDPGYRPKHAPFRDGDLYDTWDLGGSERVHGKDLKRLGLAEVAKSDLPKVVALARGLVEIDAEDFYKHGGTHYVEVESDAARTPEDAEDLIEAGKRFVKKLGGAGYVLERATYHGGSSPTETSPDPNGSLYLLISGKQQVRESVEFALSTLVEGSDRLEARLADIMQSKGFGAFMGTAKKMLASAKSEGSKRLMRSAVRKVATGMKSFTPAQRKEALGLLESLSFKNGRYQGPMSA